MKLFVLLVQILMSLCILQQDKRCRFSDYATSWTIRGS